MPKNAGQLGDLDEDSLLARLKPCLATGSHTLVGSGDDCAVVQSTDGTILLLKTDALLEGRHYEPGTKGEEIGRKALARPLSDIAAMGGTPRHALVTLASCSEAPISEIEAIYEGLSRTAAEYGLDLVGGETVVLPSSSPLFLSISLTGEMPPGSAAMLRSGAAAGDLLAVTGLLGRSFPTAHHLHFQPRLAEGRWLAQQEGVTAAMDLSDGIGSDLPRLARASGCSFELEPDKIPRRDGASLEEAVGDGEDYELLLAIQPQAWPEISERWTNQFPNLPLTRIGQLATPETAAPSWLIDGWDHFHSEARS